MVLSSHTIMQAAVQMPSAPSTLSIYWNSNWNEKRMKTNEKEVVIGPYCVINMLFSCFSFSGPTAFRNWPNPKNFRWTLQSSEAELNLWCQRIQNTRRTQSLSDKKMKYFCAAVINRSIVNLGRSPRSWKKICSKKLSYPCFSHSQIFDQQSMIYNFFGRKSGKSRFPPKLKHQE